MKKCEECGAELVRRQKRFCTHHCQSIWLQKHGPKYKNKKRTCSLCGKAFISWRGSAKYCSDRCKWKAAYRKRAAKGNRRPFPYQAVWSRRRQEIRDQQSNLCWLCGERLESRFELHHLDYDDHDVFSEKVVALHSGCHRRIHHITVSISEDGQLSFHGKALELLKEKLNGNDSLYRA